MLRKILTIGSVLFLLLSLVSLFVPNILIHETHQAPLVHQSPQAQFFTYYLESERSGFELVIPIICTILLFITALFIYVRKINPMLAISFSVINTFVILFFFYSRLILKDEINDVLYSYSAGNGFYMSIAARVGILCMAAGSLFVKSDLIRSEGLLDSI